MTKKRYQEIHRIYKYRTDQDLAEAAKWLAANADNETKIGQLATDHWIVVEDIIETRK